MVDALVTVATYWFATEGDLAKKIATPEELRKLAAEIDAEDGAVDREYYGDVLPPDAT